MAWSPSFFILPVISSGLHCSEVSFSSTYFQVSGGMRGARQVASEALNFAFCVARSESYGQFPWVLRLSSRPTVLGCRPMISAILVWGYFLPWRVAMVKRSRGSGACRTFVLGFGFDEVNQSRSSGPDPLISDPLHFRVESKFRKMADNYALGGT